MISVDNPTYQETLDLLAGRKRLSPMYAELKDWLLHAFQITAYNFEFREMTWAHAPARYRLMLLLSSKATTIRCSTAAITPRTSSPP